MKHIREQVGLSQLEMASYLQQSRSMFSRFEAGTRNLPNEAVMKIVRVQEILSADEEKERSAFAIAELANMLEQEKKELQRNLVHFKAKAEQLEADFEKVRKNYLEAHAMLNLAKRLLDECPEGDEGQRDREFLQSFEFNAIEKIRSNNRAVQAIIKFKIELFCQLQKRIAEEITGLCSYEI